MYRIDSLLAEINGRAMVIKDSKKKIPTSMKLGAGIFFGEE